MVISILAVGEVRIGKIGTREFCQPSPDGTREEGLPCKDDLIVGTVPFAMP